MNTNESVFLDQSGKDIGEDIDFWDSHVVTKAEIDAEIERLAALDKPANGRRESIVKHPRATAPGNGFAPGTRVTISVLKPGEVTEPFRHNATEVNFCIQGRGHTVVGGKRIDFGKFDVWNHPAYTVYQHYNDTDELQVRLTYSNAALLDMMNIYITDNNPPSGEPIRNFDKEKERKDPRTKDPFGTFQLTDDGAWLMPYETLINPPSVESNALYWEWEKVKEHLDKLDALGQDYIGRRLYTLYNPMTGRTNGITPSFFATITIRPAKIVDRPHRHTSAAINYIFEGHGRSTVEGKKLTWGAGDLILTAPGWAVHNHASEDVKVYELTIQDQPFNIAMECMLWQEDLKLPPAVLGAQPGFGTNRAAE